MLGPHDPVSWGLVKVGVSGWAAFATFLLGFSDEVNGALLAASVACLLAFVGFATRLSRLLLRLVEAWVDMKVSRFMMQQGYDKATIDEVLDDEV